MTIYNLTTGRMTSTSLPLSTPPPTNTYQRYPGAPKKGPRDASTRLLGPWYVVFFFSIFFFLLRLIIILTSTTHHTAMSQPPPRHVQTAAKPRMMAGTTNEEEGEKG